MYKKLNVSLFSALIMCSTLSSYGQSSSINIGPTVAYDYYETKLLNSYSSDIKSVNLASYGIDLSYSKNRFLFDLKVMTSKRTYLLTKYTPSAQPSEPNGVERIKSSAQSYIIPITISYQIAKVNHLQAFVGVGLTTEWVPGIFKQEQITMLGSDPSTNVNAMGNGSTFNFGGNLQGTVRYHINESWLIQVEPTFRYFPDIQTSFGFGSRKEISGLLTVAFKLH